MSINNVIPCGEIPGPVQSRTPIHFDFRFKVVLFIFLFWTFLQVIVPMQFLPVDLVKRLEYLKATLPAFGVLWSLCFFLDRLRITKSFIPFLLFSAFAFFNAGCHIFVLDANQLQVLAQPIMFFVWTFCMFMLVPSVFDSLSKVRVFLRYSVFLLVFGLLLASLWSYLHGFEIARSYGGSRMGALRYSFIFLNPGYLGGICYSVICCSLMLGELSKRRFEKKLLLLFMLISLVVMVLASSRTYILASLILFLIYFWRRGGGYRHISGIILVCSVPGFLLVVWRLCIKENYFYYLNFLSSNRLLMWLGSWRNLMLNGIEWKLFVGNGIYMCGWDQAIVVAGGRVTKTLTRLAIDNVYLEIFIMHGLIGILLFFWGLYRLLAMGQVFGKLKHIPGGARYKNLLSITYGALVGIFVSAVFSSHFPSLGNTINSIVFPASLAIIFIVARKVQPKSKRVTR